MISSDLGKLKFLSKPPLLLPESFESSSEVLLDDDLEVFTFGAILLRNRNALKTSLML